MARIFCVEFFAFMSLPCGAGFEDGIIHFQQVDAGAQTQTGKELREVCFLGGNEVAFFGFGVPAVALQHFPLGRDHLIDRAVHEDDFAAMPGWQVWQQGGNEFDDLAGGLLDEARGFLQRRDVLPFPVTFQAGAIEFGPASGGPGRCRGRVRASARRWPGRRASGATRGRLPPARGAVAGGPGFLVRILMISLHLASLSLGPSTNRGLPARPMTKVSELSLGSMPPITRAACL